MKNKVRTCTVCGAEGTLVKEISKVVCGECGSIIKKSKDTQNTEVERGTTKMRGTCDKFLERGFGFIIGEDLKKYFVHQSAILMPGFRKLDPGQEVEFDVEEDERGPRAVNVQPLDLPGEQPKSFRDDMVTKEE